jgi:hypothetical protein
VRKEAIYNNLADGNEYATGTVTLNNETGNAFTYQELLLRKMDRPILGSYKRSKDSAIIL